MKTLPIFLLVAAFALPQEAFAEDRLLIWQPTKTSDMAYTARVGVRLPHEIALSTGLELGMVTSEGGHLVEAPVAAWGDLSLRESNNAALTISQKAGGRVDPRNGSASLTMNYYEKYIATPSLNIERSSTYAVRYSGRNRHWTGLETKQSFRLSRVRTGSSLVADAATAETFAKLSWTVGVEQKLAQGLILKATLREGFAASEPVASVRADYSFRW